MNVWQIAAGDGSRDYSDVFLHFGVMLVGPGSYGPYPSQKHAYTDPSSDAYRDFLSTFAETVQKGDLIILKRPSSSEWEIIAVGTVESDYLHEPVFGDVDGWDLQHCRRVAWKTPPQMLVVPGLRRGTLYGVNKPEPITKAREILANGASMSPYPIPAPAPEIAVDDVIDSLITRGVSANTAELVSNTIWRLRRLAKWYSVHGSDVGEHEIRAFLIVPLFVALGWSEQRLKIEWDNIDVAFFDSSYSKSAVLRMIVESKRLDDGLRYAPDQAKGYSEKYPRCDRFVVSDGIRYKLFSRHEDNWRFEAYLNLLAPRARHPYYSEVRGAVDFFMGVLPVPQSN